MSFDLEKFDATNITDRTKDIPVPEFKQFFAKDEEPIWTVRALAGEEMAHCRAAQDDNVSRTTIIEGLMSESPEDKVQAIKDAMGMLSDTVPVDYVWRLKALELGSVNPKIDHAQSVRVGAANSNVFYKLTNEITRLSGEGQTLGE